MPEKLWYKITEENGENADASDCPKKREGGRMRNCYTVLFLFVSDFFVRFMQNPLLSRVALA